MAMTGACSTGHTRAVSEQFPIDFESQSSMDSPKSNDISCAQLPVEGRGGGEKGEGGSVCVPVVVFQSSFGAVSIRSEWREKCVQSLFSISGTADAFLLSSNFHANFQENPFTRREEGEKHPSPACLPPKKRFTDGCFPIVGKRL